MSEPAIERILLTAEQIDQRIREVAGEISAKYGGREVKLIGVLKGSVFFLTALARELSVPLKVDFLAVSSFANQRGAPGMVRISSMVRGTLPPKSAITRFAAPTIDLALLLKKPVLRMSFANTSGATAAKSAIVGYLANNPGVTSLTRLSVHCAERIVATRSSQGLWCSNAHVASGYISSRPARISATRCFRSAAFFGRFT